MNPIPPIALCLLANIGPGALSVRGITISSPKSEVIASFGIPIQVERHLEKEEGEGFWETIYFYGLSIDVEVPSKTPDPLHVIEPRVWRILITGPQWALGSQLRIGQTREQAIKILGTPISETTKGQNQTVHFPAAGLATQVWVTLRSNKIIEICIEKPSP
ncbi:outer membrane protein assembly factor BamE [Geothrix alkalitolerans]|uniref:outer membrane protein assembly factor BamE n=1 Tax=Geothrix alkalitolerans TaxID=2922724 RepID=UPI001FAEF743|nr:outer membrane protein assembly factor BamE [Geothrix alkalitolerans]